MGYLKEKYTKGYFLNKDEQGNTLSVGVAGLEEFNRGDIRPTDKMVLERVDFSGKNVLDIGYGRGEALKFAYDSGASMLVGVDFSPSSYDIAHQMLKRNGIFADLYCDDALHFIKEFCKKGKKFDVVSLLDFVEHVPRSELKEMFVVLRNALNPHALVCINTPVFKVDNDVILDGLKEEAMDTSDENEETAGMHCNRYTKESLRSFLKECGFSAISGHFFTNSSLDYRNLSSADRWNQAKSAKIPLKGEWREEYFEYALTSKEMEQKARRENNSHLFTNDYNLNVLHRVDFDNFFLHVTERYRYHYTENDYEKFSADLFTQSISEDSTVIDVGGHYGFYTLLAATKAKKGSVVAFEPVIENFELLKKNINENGLKNVVLENAAVSSDNGLKEFYVTEASDSSGFSEHPLTKTKEVRKIKSVNLDSYIGQKMVDVIKMDTEGYEMSVLMGMENIIRNNPNLRLFIELNPQCLKNAHTKPTELLQKIIEYGFDIFIIDDQERKLFQISDDISRFKEILGGKEYANILCVKKEKSMFVSFLSHSAVKCGAELALLDLIEGLTARGVLCHVFLPGEGELTSHLRGMPVSLSLAPLPRWASAKNIQNFYPEKAIGVSCAEIAHELSLIRPDIVYTNTGVINQGSVVAKLLGVPHVWHIHEFGEQDHQYSFLFNLEKRRRYIAEFSDVCIFNSEATKKVYTEGVSINKVIVAYNAVKIRDGKENSERFFARLPSLKLALLGQIHEGKGQLEAARAINFIQKNFKNVDIELALAGPMVDSEYHDQLAKYIEENHLEHMIRYHGNLKNVVPIITQSDAVLMCSKNEAFGRITVEAMLLKKPVIGFMKCGTTEILIDGKNGLGYDSFEKFTENLVYAFQNKEKMKALGIQAQAIVENKFTQDGYVKKIYHILWQLKSEKNTKKSWEVGELLFGTELEVADSNPHQKFAEVESIDILQKELDRMRSSLRWKFANFPYKIYREIKRYIPRQIFVLAKPLFELLNYLRKK